MGWGKWRALREGMEPASQPLHKTPSHSSVPPTPEVLSEAHFPRPGRQGCASALHSLGLLRLLHPFYHKPLAN